MPTFFENSLLNALATSSAWLVISFTLFGLLQEARPVVFGQKWLRKNAGVDLFYWFAGPIAYGFISSFLFLTGLSVIHGGDSARIEAFLDNGWGPLGDLPILVQALIGLVVTDFIMYWSHRMFHTGRLWRYHAIHHSSEVMDFLSAVRFHPFNTIFYSVLATVIVLWMGIDPLALAVLGPFNILYSGLVHANVDWDFGPFKKVLASPIYHRWHHTGPDEGGERNFSPTFPIWDLMFGTYYMPEGKKPLNIGVVERDVPETVWGQMVHPFRNRNAPEDPLIADVT
jgi:sterol desaturase/sphingolipid hydroxylase (fatty acid hydroxylase superfamily)